MPLWHHDMGKKKITGGRKKLYRTKRRFEAGGSAAETSFGTSSRRIRRARSGLQKTKLLSEKFVNITDPAEKITKRSEILRVISNAVNADYNRRRIITRGALIETSLGEATITSRPGQDGILNAVLSNKRR